MKSNARTSLSRHDVPGVFKEEISVVPRTVWAVISTSSKNPFRTWYLVFIVYLLLCYLRRLDSRKEHGHDCMAKSTTQKLKHISAITKYVLFFIVLFSFLEKALPALKK